MFDILSFSKDFPKKGVVEKPEGSRGFKSKFKNFTAAEAALDAHQPKTDGARDLLKSTKDDLRRLDADENGKLRRGLLEKSNRMSPKSDEDTLLRIAMSKLGQQLQQGPSTDHIKPVHLSFLYDHIEKVKLTLGDELGNNLADFLNQVAGNTESKLTALHN